MLRSYLFVCLSVIASASATPITGSFELATNANLVDIFGVGTSYVWRFHQGDGPTLYRACDSLICSIDGSNGPDPARIFDSLGFAHAEIGGFAASIGFFGPNPTPDGNVGGSITWHIARTDWSSLPIGATLLDLPMEITGLLIATDAQGHEFMNDLVRAQGTFHTRIEKNSATDYFFLGARGEFKGTATTTPEPATLGVGIGLIGLVFLSRIRSRFTSLLRRTAG